MSSSQAQTPTQRLASTDHRPRRLSGASQAGTVDILLGPELVLWMVRCGAARHVPNDPKNLAVHLKDGGATELNPGQPSGQRIRAVLAVALRRSLDEGD
jgi:hypothetical protein